jgi:hypothetical protein
MGLIRTGAATLDLSEMLEKAWGSGEFRAPSLDEFNKARRLFTQMLTARADTALQEQWNVLGFEWLTPSNSPSALWVLREREGRLSGGGFYLFRPQAQREIACEAPHARSDLHTGSIALELFLEGGFCAGAWGTVSRCGADLAHLDRTFFQAFTLAFAEAHPRGILAQFHGFEPSPHREAQGKPVDLVISSGSSRHPEWLTVMVRRLKTELPDSTWWVYPTNTRELGGTRNAQALALQQMNWPGFLHLELGLEFRQRLLHKPAQRSQLLQCLPVSQESPEPPGKTGS